MAASIWESPGARGPSGELPEVSVAAGTGITPSRALALLSRFQVSRSDGEGAVEGCGWHLPPWPLREDVPLARGWGGYSEGAVNQSRNPKWHKSRREIKCIPSQPE